MRPSDGVTRDAVCKSAVIDDESVDPGGPAMNFREREVFLQGIGIASGKRIKSVGVTDSGIFIDHARGQRSLYAVFKIFFIQPAVIEKQFVA